MNNILITLIWSGMNARGYYTKVVVYVLILEINLLALSIMEGIK